MGHHGEKTVGSRVSEDLVSSGDERKVKRRPTGLIRVPEHIPTHRNWPGEIHQNFRPTISLQALREVFSYNGNP